MIRVCDFFKSSASDGWFTMTTRIGSVHEQLLARGYTLIDQSTLAKDYKELSAPVPTVSLSYVESVPKPTPGYKCVFLNGHAYDIRQRAFKDRLLGDVISEWLDSTLSGEKYLISLNPMAYLCAKSKSIKYDEIFDITRAWGIDCTIGVFDKTGQSMFVFNDEFALTHISFASDNLPAEFNEVSVLCSGITASGGMLPDLKARTGGDPERIEEYYGVVVKPFLAEQVAI